MPLVGMSLADGQLANAKATIYTCPALTVAHITSIVLVNTDAVARTVNLYVKRSGSTSRRIIGKAVSIPVAGSYEFPDKAGAMRLSAGDVIEGDASVAAVVDYFITGAQET